MSTAVLSIDQLLKLRSTQSNLVLLDVRLASDYEAAHLPSAVNQCVFEVVFLDQLSAKGISKDKPVCVYGAGEDSHESRVAATKLEKAGYREVHDFQGGLQAWVSAGRPTEGKGESQPPALADGRHALDLQESRVDWIGRNLINKNYGQVAIAEGFVHFRQGVPQRGEAVLDMRRITCANLAGTPLHDVLVHHLQSDDFFDVEKYHQVRFVFDRTENISPTIGSRNLRLHGALTVKDTSRPLVIEAEAGVTPEGQGALQAVFEIDRTEWGVIYGSGKFFKRLGGHLVNDYIELQLRLLTVPQ